MNQDNNKNINTNNSQITERFISLERIIASKNKKLLKIIPKFSLNWFKRLIHLDEINSAIYRHRDIIGSRFATAIIEKDFGAKVLVINPENIPTSGRQLIVANHPLGGADGMALISEVGKVRNDILFPVNDILCNLPGLKPIFIPINKYGRNIENHSTLDKAFEGDSCILFFPAGMVSRKQDGIIKDLEWKKSFIKKSIDHKRDIIPVHIEARNTEFFYRFANFRKKIGMKFNIELIFLPAEMFKQKGKTIKLVFGKAIPYTIFDKTYSYQDWAEKIKNHVYFLKDNPNLEFKK